MKRIEAIIRPTMAGKVCIALERAGHPGPMISQIARQVGQKGVRHYLRGKTYDVNLLTRTRVEVIVKDGEAENIVKAIRDAAFTGEIVDERIFIHHMEDAMQVCTAE